MAQSPEQMAASMVANMKAKTGKTLPQWTAIARKFEEQKHGGIVKRLKCEFDLGHGYASFVAHEVLNGGAQGGDLVEAQYAGEKAALKPIYDKIVKLVCAFGEDVEVSPKKTYVSLRRAKQFALIQPSTKTRVDLGINLKGKPAAGRLEPSGSFNAMVSHRVKLSSAADIDKEVKAWLKEAYDAS